jgi:peptidoglycan/LPS O-acetylase OafA/YrhL
MAEEAFRPIDGRAEHVREFDGLRGIAILAVLVHHFWPSSGALAAWSSLPHLGWVGVDLFFVLSGCLITGILLDTRGEPGSLRNFYARRVIRIAPLYYLVVVGAFLVIPRLQGSTEFAEQSGSPWWYLLYLGNARESLTGHEPAYILAVTWSLCIEEQFYLLFPFVVAWLRPTKLATLCWTMVAFAPLFRIVTMLLWPENERIQYLATPSRVDVLALGGLIALGVRGHCWLPNARAVRVLLPAALVACALAFLAGGLDRTTLFGRTLGYSLVAVAAFSLVLWTAQRRGTATAAWLRWSPLCGLGVLCYGIYLLQRPAQVLAGKAFGWLFPSVEVVGTAWGLVLFPLAALAAAIASWYLLERPCLALKRYFVTQTPTRARTSPAPTRPEFTIEIEKDLPLGRPTATFVPTSIADLTARAPQTTSGRE